MTQTLSIKSPPSLSSTTDQVSPATPGVLTPPTGEGGSTAQSATSVLSAAAASQLLPGRVLEQLLLNPQTVPQAELKLLRQGLQERLSHAEALPIQQEARYQIAATLLTGADGLPLINPQLQQQLERKQAAAVGSQLPRATALQEKMDTLPSPTNTRSQANIAAASSSAGNMMSREVSSELLQLAQRLVTEESVAIPERHQLLLLATLLVDEGSSPLTNLDQRSRRRLAQRLSLMIKSKIEGSSTATRGDPGVAQTSSRSSVVNRLPVGERWTEDPDDDLDHLPQGLLWPGLTNAPTSVKPAQIETVLDNLLDKQVIGVTGRGGMQQFVGKASMDQLLMMVSTLMIKVNSTMAQSVLDSQKIVKETTDKVGQNQLAKQIEEFEKAQKEQEQAKKAGIFGKIFNWVVAVVTVVVAVVTMNPVAIVGAILNVIGTALDTAIFALGDKAPHWLQKLATTLQVVGGVLSAFAGLLKNIGVSTFKTLIKAGSTVMREGLKSALKQGIHAAMKAVTKAFKQLLEWIKSTVSQVQASAKKIGTSIKQAGQRSVEAVNNPKAAAQQLWQKNKQAGEWLGNKIEHPEKIKMRADTIKKVAEGVGAATRSTAAIVDNTSQARSAQIQAEIKQLQNESWLLDIILEAYQKQRKQMHSLVADLYQQQGEGVAMVSEQLKENAGLQNRIASSLA